MTRKKFSTWQFWKCPICEKSVKARGKNGHVRLAHKGYVLINDQVIEKHKVKVLQSSKNGQNSLELPNVIHSNKLEIPKDKHYDLVRKHENSADLIRIRKMFRETRKTDENPSGHTVPECDYCLNYLGYMARVKDMEGNGQLRPRKKYNGTGSAGEQPV